MKRFFCLFIFCIVFGAIKASAGLNGSPHENYTDSFWEECANLCQSSPGQRIFFMSDFVVNENIPSDKKKELLEKVYTNPGYYSPDVLLGSGLGYVYLKDFEKGAVLYMGALGRMEIDERLVDDHTGTQDGLVYEMLFQYVHHAILACGLTDEEKQAWLKAKRMALGNFENWNKAFPRDYRSFEEWEEQESAFNEAEKAVVISRFCREISSDRVPEVLRGEDFLVDETDDFFFNSQDRIYYVNDGSSSLSFAVPVHITPILGRYGEYEGLFQLSGSGVLSVRYWKGFGQAAHERSLSERCRDVFASENQIPFLTGTYFCEPNALTNRESLVENRRSFQHGDHFYEFQVISRPEEEEECLKDLELLLFSIR